MMRSHRPGESKREMCKNKTKINGVRVYRVEISVYTVSLFEPFVRKWCASLRKKPSANFCFFFSLHFVRFQKKPLLPLTVMQTNRIRAAHYRMAFLWIIFRLVFFSFVLQFVHDGSSAHFEGDTTLKKNCKMRANLRRIGEANAISRK